MKFLFLEQNEVYLVSHLNFLYFWVTDCHLLLFLFVELFTPLMAACGSSVPDHSSGSLFSSNNHALDELGNALTVDEKLSEGSNSNSVNGRNLSQLIDVDQDNQSNISTNNQKRHEAAVDVALSPGGRKLLIMSFYWIQTMWSCATCTSDFFPNLN